MKRIFTLLMTVIISTTVYAQMKKNFYYSNSK